MSNQIVSTEKTFTEALRKVLRQSPDPVYCPKLGGWLSAAEFQQRLQRD